MSTAAQLAYDTMTYYKGNLSGQTPGILPGPPPAGDYYWWEAGALWGAMVEYWHYTGDTTYNDVVTDALLFQVGPNKDYMPPNVTASLGNDDQVRVPFFPVSHGACLPRQYAKQARRAGFLGHECHDSRRVEVSQSARRRTSVGGPRTGRIQHPSRPLEARFDLQRRTEMADSLVQQWLQLQE